MLTFVTKRPVAVFDLDGVIVKNPDAALSTTITDGNFWLRHWNNYAEAEFNQEVVEMVQDLANAGYAVVILTARPESFRSQTEALLRRVNILVSGNDETGKRDTEVRRYGCMKLVMLPGSVVPQSSGVWKRDVIADWLDQGANLRFMVEDYKPNADAIRSLLPVFLYERVK